MIDSKKLEEMGQTFLSLFMLMVFRLSSVKGASVFIWSEEASSTIARNLSDKKRECILAEIKNLKPTDFNEDYAREQYPDVYEKIKQSKILKQNIRST